MFRTLFPALALLTLTSLASAQADETRCRSVESVYHARANGEGTATGFDTDVVVIRRNNGTAIVAQSVGYLRRNRPLFVNGATAHSGGQYSIRIAYWWLLLYYPNLRGGSVEVWRGNTLIDRDSLI